MSQAEHPDRPRALLADVRVLALGWPPTGCVQDWPEQVLDETSERPLRRVAYRVVREPRERIGYRCEDRAIVFPPELFDATQEGGERRLAVTDEGPEIVEERETTTVILPGWTATMDKTGCLVVKHVAAAKRDARRAERTSVAAL